MSLPALSKFPVIENSTITEIFQRNLWWKSYGFQNFYGVFLQLGTDYKWESIKIHIGPEVSAEWA